MSTAAVLSVGKREVQVRRAGWPARRAPTTHEQRPRRPGAGRRSRAQRTPLLRIWPSVVARRRAARRTRPPNALDFSMPRIAGSRVSATSTAMNTVPAAARPMLVRNGMPTTTSADRAMSTVRPAKTTAEPAVPTATPDGLLAVVGVVQLGAVAGQDEQRVVDADRQADHRGQRSGCVEPMSMKRGGDRVMPVMPSADAEQRGEDRQAGGDQRAEGQDQHDERDADADQLGRAAGRRPSPTCRSRWPRRSGRRRGPGPARP